MFNTVVASVRSSAVRASFLNARALHSTPVAAKTVTEKVSEVADKINKNVGKGLASAIETGEQATHTAKEKLGSATEETKEKAEKASELAGQKTNQAAAGARQAKEDLEKEVKK
ncbi:hypothetical protein D9615_006345 [Tricholomella constricta]|uniref:Uncharacterized protein n=1 Tax=Tricholomella constricta TaxID=117010 RepID=A0A8H5H5T4_9AGAR|nr:hypothetical protein D9615_006345 [Tricholomella constricta]